MDDEVIVGRFGTPLEAELARVFLESHAVEVRIADDLLIGAAILLEPGLGGVKLLVPGSDAARAQTLIDEYQHWQRAPRRAETPDERAARAARAAMVGCVLFPGGLHLYSLWLLLRTPYRQLSSRARLYFWLATLLDLYVLGALVAVVHWL